MKKVFILNPLIYGRKKSLMPHRKRQPLSLAIIASLLKTDFTVEFLDANALDLDSEQAVKQINDSQPDFLILTSTPIDRWECPNSYIDSVFDLINQVKGPRIILTGSHGTATPNWIFQNCQVDFVVLGEPELTVSELVKVLSAGQDYSKIFGLAYKDSNGQIKISGPADLIKDLDALPMPAYELLPMAKYRYTFPDLEQPFSIMMTSLGCPFGCVYCLKIMAAGGYISRTPQNVISEIEYLIKNFGIKSIFFQDWEFMIDQSRVEQLCKLIIEKGLKFNWGCNGRAPDIKDDLVKLMKQAGCVRINMGFESGSQKILNNIKKNITLEQLAWAIKVLKENQLNFSLYTLLGLPGETRASIKETVSFLAQNRVQPSMVSLVIPYFGTELFLQVKNRAGLSWSNIEKLAGRVNSSLSPFWARFWFNYYKYKFNYGSLFFLKPKFWQVALKRFF